jgi:ligand-binding sensor domain-containing protein/signal transduction histidine kinase
MIAGPRRRSVSLTLLAGFAGLMNTALAFDPAQAMSQYTRKEWGPDQGFMGGTVYALAQTPDGYLWIGGERGLVRFDGLNFVVFDETKSAAIPPGPVLGLSTDAEGSLWIRMQSPRLLRARGETFQDVSRNFVHPSQGVTAMCHTKDGTMLFSALTSGTLRFRDGRWMTSPFTAGRRDFLVISMAQTTDGNVWLGTRDAGLFVLGAGTVFPTKGDLPDRKINCLLPAADGTMWVGTDNGVARWNGTEVSRSGVSPGLQQVQVLAMTRDRESTTWVGTSNGLFRIDGTGVEHDALSSGAVTALFEDREGNLWAGGKDQIRRYRKSAFLTYSTEQSGPVYADAAGHVWFACANGLFRMSGQRAERIVAGGLDRDVVYSIAGGGDEVWVGRQLGGLTQFRYRAGLLECATSTHGNGLAQNRVYAVHRSRDGTVWAGTLNGGVSRLSDGRFTTYTTVNGLASNTVTAIEESPDGTMWFATPNGLSALTDGHWKVYTGLEGLPPGDINCLYADSAGVLWIGTDEGLAVFRSGRVQMPGEAPASLREPVVGIAADKRGALWIATSHHVLRVRRERLLAGNVREGDAVEFGTSEGLLSTEGVKRSRSVVADPSGRIWFSMNRGISVVDPSRTDGTSVPAIVHIQSVSADGNPIDVRDTVHVPAARKRIILGYTGLSLAMPESVRYRYRLEGFDSAWSQPVAAREAVYTNLGPGSYRFRVMAANSEGRWNSSEAVIGLEIDPALWQTRWFQLSSVAACVLLSLGLYRYRTRQLIDRLNIRFEERIAERTRIARELHDTLLQGVLSASMQLHLAADSLPADSPLNPPLNRVIELMAGVIDEGRNTVQGLRSAEDSFDLAEAFSRIQRELAFKPDAGLRVIVEGRSRPLRPVLRDEVYRIGREALVNAFRHSGASHIEVELEYASTHLRMVVRDDGSGIDAQVMGAGREGHWGLPGMRERAECIGARLSLWSRETAGTEVELLVPSHLAYETEPANRTQNWVSRLSGWISGRSRIEDNP